MYAIRSYYVQILGIDVGGTGIKAGVVETTTGELVCERVRIETPRPATPDTVITSYSIHYTKLYDAHDISFERPDLGQSAGTLEQVVGVKQLLLDSYNFV